MNELQQVEKLERKLKAIRRIDLASHRLGVLLMLINQDADCDSTLDKLFIDINEIREIVSPRATA